MKKNENPIFVTKSFLPPFEEYTKEIETIWASSWLTNNGSLHQKFEHDLLEYLNTPYLSLFTNGHLALESAIKALGLKGEVITTPFTFASTTHAIVNCGLTPVFCDISPFDFNIDVEKIEKLISPNTSAILPVHVFGNPCDMQSIENIAQKYGLKVIYDSAHAFGVKVNGVPIGNFGDISMFSLHATKVFHSIEGGILSYNTSGYKRLLELYKNFGISGPESVEMVGINAKMNEFQAAMGIINLRYIALEIEKRKQITFQYRNLLRKIKGIGFLQDIGGVEHNYSYFPIQVDENTYGLTRDGLHERLKEYNIFTRKYFYPLCSDFHCYKPLFNNIDLPNAEFIANRILTLPLFSDLTIEQVDYICEAIQELSTNH
jgi:dTDP-4-amino-4,6-dideoxygalactose transaminase